MESTALARVAMKSFLQKRFSFSCCRNATNGSAFGNFSKTNCFGKTCSEKPEQLLKKVISVQFLVFSVDIVDEADYAIHKNLLVVPH
jgi:hypothetical protein